MYGIKLVAMTTEKIKACLPKNMEYLKFLEIAPFLYTRGNETNTENLINKCNHKTKEVSL